MNETSDGQHDAWLAEYKKCGIELEAAIGATLQTAVARGSTPLALPEIRKQRASFTIKFCLLLYARTFAVDLLQESNESEGEVLTDGELEECARTARENLSEALAILMPTLHKLADTHMVLLEPENDQSSGGPVRMRLPKHLWFGCMAQLAELAHVIVAVGGTGRHLLEEVNYLGKAGLGDRLLIYSKGKLLAGDDADNPCIWQVDQFGKAVETAAAFEPAKDSVSFIENPTLPTWFVDELRERYEPPAG